MRKTQMLRAGAVVTCMLGVGCSSYSSTFMPIARDQCEKDASGVSCANLGDYYMRASWIAMQKDWGERLDKKKATLAYAKACDRGWGGGCRRLIEFDLIADPTQRAQIEQKAIELHAPPRTKEELATERAEQVKQARKLDADIAASGSSTSFGDILGATAGAMAQQSGAPGVKPETAKALSDASKITAAAGDVVKTAETLSDPSKRLGVATGLTRDAACTQANAGLSPNGPCSTKAERRDVTSCTCGSSKVSGVTTWTCKVDATYVCADSEVAHVALPAPKASGAAGAGGGAAGSGAGSATAGVAAAGEAPALASADLASVIAAADTPACAADTTCKYMLAQCKKNEISGCKSLGLGYDQGAFSMPKDAQRAAAVYDATCKADAKEGCLELGQIVHEGKGVAKDAARGVEVTKRACEVGKMAPACSIVSSWGDPTWAHKQLRVLCDADDPMACTYLASDPKQKDAAVTKLKALCAAGKPMACSLTTSMAQHDPAFR